MTLVRSQAGETQAGKLTREQVIEALKEYARLYGPHFTAAAFNPATARWQDRPELADQYLQGRPDGRLWPSLNAIKKLFPTPEHPKGSFNEARKAAGLPVNAVGPRREKGKHRPIRDVRIERVYVQTEGKQTAWLRRELSAQERRRERLEGQLEHAKADLATARAAASDVVRVDSDRVRELRERLADESGRRRQVQRELHNAERREIRARAREDSLRAGMRGNSAMVREIERLTERLAFAQEQISKLKTGATPYGVHAEPPREVVREVRVPDERTAHRLERAIGQLEELRRDLAQAREERDDLADRLDTIRADAIAQAAADQRVQEAERTAAKAESKQAELAALVTGERRKLTVRELADLRRDGAAGRPMFERAVIKALRAKPGDLHNALTEAIREGLAWRDRL